MIALAWFAALQAAALAGAPPVPERFSILADPCARASDARGNDILVCGKGANTPRLPLPDERGPPDGPAPSNPYLTGTGALAAQGTPCAATQEGCLVGFGPPVMPVIKAAANVISGAVKDRRDRAARRRDGAKRVAIPLDDSPGI